MQFGTSNQVKHVNMSWIIDNKQYGSLNHPTVIVGDDNTSYQVKFNKPDDMRIGINELVCTLIGLELELPVFEPVIANVSQDIIDGNKKLEQYCAGEHFAQVFLEPFETVNSYKFQGKQIIKDNIGNIGLVPDFIIYDKYIENFDRHGDNICLLSNSTLASKVDYYLFDHDLAFQRHPTIKNDIQGLRQLKTKLKHMHFFVDHINKTSLFYRGTSKIIRLSKKISGIMNKVPQSWKTGYENYLGNIEVLLTNFTETMANEHISLNKDKWPSLK